MKWYSVTKLIFPKCSFAYLCDSIIQTIVTITRSVKKLIPSCQNCQPENTHNACKQIITLRFAVKTHLKINAQKRYLHQNDSFGLFSFIGRSISSFRRFVWPQFVIFHRKDEFTSHINSIHPAIKFTREEEKDMTIAMLDAKITRTPAGRMSFSVFCKPTHTD